MPRNATIHPLTPPSHGDFFAVAGTDFPPESQLAFESERRTVLVTPDVIRPHWAFVAELPVEVRPGRTELRVLSPGWRSEPVELDVAPRPRARLTVLYPAGGEDSFTVVFVANPALMLDDSGLVRDPILSDRHAYHDAVSFCLENLLTLPEDVLTKDCLDAHVRFVSLFDKTLPPTECNALVTQQWKVAAAPNQRLLPTFLDRYGLSADIVFLVHAAPIHLLSLAPPTADDDTSCVKPFTYDGHSRTHPARTRVPGCLTIRANTDRRHPVPLHEFLHAASSTAHGKVVDLHADGLAKRDFVVNKKQRRSSQDPIPAHFASYNGSDYCSDLDRLGSGYPADWTSYHCAPIVAELPNVMDDYTKAVRPLSCRLDVLTYAWLRDRLRTRVLR